MVRISVAMCTFESIDFIQGQLDSIFNQTLKPFEIVICDDSSTALVENFVRNYESDIPISYFRNEKRLGVIKNFEKAISICNGDYVATSDQDDVWKSDKLEVLHDKIKHQTGPSLVYSNFLIVDEKLKEIKSLESRKESINFSSPRPPFSHAFQNFVPGCTMMFNRELINIALPFSQDVVMHDWWISLVANFKGEIIYVPKKLVMYRQHASNQVGLMDLNFLSKIKRRLFNWEIYQRLYKSKLQQLQSVLALIRDDRAKFNKMSRYMQGLFLLRKKVRVRGVLETFYMYFSLIFFTHENISEEVK